jgi:hypothetical protein
MTTGHEYPTLLGTSEYPVFAPDSRTLATFGDDGRIRFWDLPPRKPLGIILAWSCLPSLAVFMIAWLRERRKNAPTALKSDSA